MSKVAFIKTDDRATGVRQAVELLGINPVEGKSVFLKPNYNSDDPAPGSTHPDVLRAMVLKLQEMGAASITVGDRSGMGNTRAVMENLGVFAMGKELGFDVVNPKEEDLVKYVFDRTNGAGADVVFEVTGTQAGAEMMTKLPCTGGRIVIVAIFAEPMMVDLRTILWREYTVVGARNYLKEDFDEAIRLVVEGNLALDKIVSDIRPVDRTQETFEEIVSGKADFMKVLISAKED